MADYLYGGVQCPDINEVWANKETRPYACIGYKDEVCRLHFFTNKVTCNRTGFVVGSLNNVFILNSSGEWEKTSNLDSMNGAKPVWSNFDIYYADDAEEVGGTLYLAASEPVPVLEIQIPKGVDRYSYVVGFNLALAGMAYPYSAPTPVAYLYNGIRLPALPEWDRGVYPYAYIVGLHPTHFCASPNEPYVIETENFITGEKGHATKFRENTTVLRWYPN